MLMTNGIKPSQHQIDGIRREKMALRRAEVRKQKFPIINMTFKEAWPIAILFALAMLIGANIP